MESTSIIIGLEIGLFLAIIYVLDRNVFHAVDLIFRGIPVWFELRRNKILLGIRLWFDRQAYKPTRLGRFLARQQLNRIINNPDYAEFFKDRE